MLPAIPLSAALAQSPLTLAEAVDRARSLYPAVAVSRARVEAAAAAIRLARTSYLPRLDALAQANRATRNNIYGMLLQQSIISPISGPPVLQNSAASVFGSAVGVLIDWEPFDFGQRKSQVELAEATRRRREAAVVRTQFEAGAAAADAFLTILAAQETVKAAQASVDRSKVLLTSVDALVRAELRPGADSSIARSELAAAQAQVVRGGQAVADAKAVLAGLIGESPANAVPKPLAASADEAPEPSREVNANPLAREQDAAVEEAKARVHTLDHQWAPRFSLEGTSYARGTGARPDFTTLGGANGLAPSYYNWGLGFTVRFPILDQPAVRARQAEQSASLRAEESRYQLVLTDLETRRHRALAALEAARELAKLAPVQLESARAAETQARARYQAGLATIVEVADVARTLTQAEIDHALARLNVWRSLLALRIAEGDLTPLLEKAGR